MHKQRIWMVIVVLVLAGLACQLPTIGAVSTGGDNLEPIVVSDEAADNLRDKWREIVTSPDRGFTLVVTEQELTSLVVQQLEASGGTTELQNLSLYLRDGAVIMRAQYAAEGLSAPLEARIDISVNGGALRFAISEARLGPLAVPADLLAQFQQQLDSAGGGLTEINGQVVTFESVTISEGEMTVSGAFAP